MKRALEVVLGIGLCFAPSSYAEVVVFVDGKQMEVESYEVRGKLLVLTDNEGMVCSVGLSVVNLEATKRVNRDAEKRVSLNRHSPEAMPAEAHPTRVRLARTRPARTLPAEARLAKEDSAKPRPAAARPAEARLAKADSAKPRAAEARPAEASPTETRSARARPSDSPRVGFPGSAGNPPPVGESSTKVDNVLNSLGLKSLVSQMPDFVSTTIVQAERYMLEDGPEVSGTVRSAFEQAFQADRIYPIVSRAFAERTEDSELESALLSLNSPQNRRMNELERFARTAEGLRQLQEYTLELQTTMPPAARLEKLQRLDAVMGLTGADIERRLRMLRAVMKAFNQLIPQDRRMAEEDINQVVDRGGPTLRVSMNNYSLVRLLFTYRSASDAELEKYIAFWETDEGRWLNRVTQESLSAGMLHGFETAMKHLAQQAYQQAGASTAEPEHENSLLRFRHTLAGRSGSELESRAQPLRVFLVTLDSEKQHA